MQPVTVPSFSGVIRPFFVPVTDRASAAESAITPSLFCPAIPPAASPETSPAVTQRVIVPWLLPAARPAFSIPVTVPETEQSSMVPSLIPAIPPTAKLSVALVWRRLTVMSVSATRLTTLSGSTTPNRPNTPYDRMDTKPETVWPPPSKLPLKPSFFGVEACPFALPMGVQPSPPA